MGLKYAGGCSRYKESRKGLEGASVEVVVVVETPGETQAEMLQHQYQYQHQYQRPNPPPLTAITGTNTPSQVASGWQSAVLAAGP